MTKEQQRIAIAEACGWTNVDDKMPSPTTGWVRGSLRGVNHEGYRVHVPDYLNDLNAMHEAEKIMTKDQWLSYTINVLLAAKDGTFVIDINMKTVTHASAAQRAEAFLKTLHLWNQ